MPLFEYRCQDCGHLFEAFVTASRKPACPTCQSHNLEKLVSALGMVGTAGGALGAVPSFGGT